jgi:hypothetical protein
MAITKTVKSLFRRRPPTEKQIARAEAEMIREEQRQDRAAAASRGISPPHDILIPPM